MPKVGEEKKKRERKVKTINMSTQSQAKKRGRKSKKDMTTTKTVDIKHALHSNQTEKDYNISDKTVISDDHQSENVILHLSVHSEDIQTTVTNTVNGNIKPSEQDHA